MYYDDAAECIRYLRDEADCNRSWADGCRNNAEVEYKIARLRVAADRDRWATAIEDIMRIAKAATK